MTTRVFAARLRGLFFGRRMERQMEDELLCHLEMQTEDNIRMGMSPAEAHYAAMRHFGGLDAAKEICREKRSFPMIESLLRDSGYALRSLRKTPGFTTVAILTLALGIGANTAIFSVVQAILLQPLPYANPGSLVRIWNTYPNFVGDLGLSPGDFQDFRKQTRTLTGLEAYVDLPQGFNLTGHGDPARVEARYISSGLLPLLGVRPVAGRNFSAQEDKPGAASAILISHRLWRERFGANPAAIGAAVLLDGRGYTLAGVMPASFQLAPAADIWFPLGAYPDDPAGRVHHPFTVIGRRKPGVTTAQAANEFALLNLQEASAFPAPHTNWKIFAETLENPAAGKLRPLLIVLLGAVGFVLLIACANVVNLVLARNAARQREISVRISLGASFGRLLAQLLAETALLTGCGAALGLAIAGAGLAILRNLLPPNLAPLGAARLDWPVLGFTAAISIFAVTICGLAPALRVARRDSNPGLKSTGGGIRDVLVVAETGLSIVLLLGAAVFIRSFRNALAVDPGFETTHQLSLEINQPVTPPAELARLTPAQAAELGRKQTQQFDRVLARLSVLPRVTAVGAISTMPLSSEIRSASRFVVEGRPAGDAATRPVAETRSVTAGYFAAMGIPLRAGRWLTQDDINGNNILVNEEMARRYWPGESAIGKRINLCSMYPTPCWLPVVGVVGNVHQYGLDAATGSSDLYFASGSAPSVIIRSGQDPAALARAAIDAIHKEAPGIPVTHVMPLEDLLSDSLAPRRFSSALLGAFATLALLLAAVGIYGVMNYIVGTRTREIGLRIALGARPARVWRLITVGAIRLALIGMALGLAGSLALSAALARTLASLAYKAHPWDPLTITASALLLAAVVVLACSVPAKRAMSVDPMTALREE